MTKQEYLNELSGKLAPIDPPMIHAILKQYEEIFADGFSQGKEFDTILTEIGTTDFVADYYKKTLGANENQNTSKEATQIKDKEVNEAKSDSEAKQRTVPVNRPIGASILRGLFVGFGLLMFNLVIVLAPYMVVWSLLIAFFATGLGLSVAGIAVILASIVSLPLSMSLTVPAAVLAHPVLLIAISVILIALGFIFVLLVLFVGKYFVIWTIQYMRWNIAMIRGDEYVK